MQVQVDPNEDTEWNDILREKGIIPQRPKSPTEDIEDAIDQAIKQQHQNRLENKTLDELDELEDIEDDAFLNSYKIKRINELNSLLVSSNFGQVYHISRPEYKSEITELKNVCVLVHLSLSSNLQSRILSNLFEKIAPIFAELKFVEILGKRAIENYPDSNCPTLLIYYNGDVLKQYITLFELGGNSTNLQDLEKVLVNLKLVKENDKRLSINNNSDIDDDNDDDDNDAYNRNHNGNTRLGRTNISSNRNIRSSKYNSDSDFSDYD
ncbi:Plp2p [Ascoidea rubescens DSM 1968]|uniref:Thioredoxin-like protein n=1 Tax=Ascoidea rubescens DSM 1968 TaxID=1344418 RepID=A0A1D2VEM4_9ASCO|nr:thioredoxin-like protein [Ascoidea rubescens DSM 1968]ODV60032.1 thioredoxin-like protein [Ascoidea rubescens DSM 1968]